MRFFGNFMWSEPPRFPKKTAFHRSAVHLMEANGSRRNCKMFSRTDSCKTLELFLGVTIFTNKQRSRLVITKPEVTKKENKKEKKGRSNGTKTLQCFLWNSQSTRAETSAPCLETRVRFRVPQTVCHSNTMSNHLKKIRAVGQCYIAMSFAHHTWNRFPNGCKWLMQIGSQDQHWELPASKFHEW